MRINTGTTRLIFALSLLTFAACRDDKPSAPGGTGGTGGRGGSGGSAGRGGAGGSGGTAGRDGGPDGPPAGTVQLKITWWGSPDRDMRTQKAIDMFTAKNPTITFVTEHYASTQGAVGTGYWPTLLKHADDKTLPDIMQHDYAYIEEWTTKGLLTPAGSADRRRLAGAGRRAPGADRRRQGRRQGDGHLAGPQHPVGGHRRRRLLRGRHPDPRGHLDLGRLRAHRPAAEAAAERLGRRLRPARLHAGLEGGLPVDEQVGVEPGRQGAGLHRPTTPWVAHWKMLLRLQAAGAIPHRWEEPIGSNVEAMHMVMRRSAMEHVHSNQLVALWTAVRNHAQPEDPAAAQGGGAGTSRPST